MADVKSGRLKAAQLPEAFGRCKDRFPGAALYVECNKRVLNGAKSGGLEAKDVAECKKYLTAASFEASDPVPFFVGGEQLFFSGIGMNGDQRLVDLSPPNFECERLKGATAAVSAKAQFILFGNTPEVFDVPEKDQRARYLATISKLIGARKGAKFLDVDDFGRVFPDPKTGQGMTYFASAACDFNGNFGSIFAGLSAFYLIDAKSQLATPYFGIAYYGQGQRAVTTPELVADVQSRLGPLYRAYSKDASTVFVAAAPFSEVDQERDPRNICKAPRPHSFVVIINTSKNDSNRPEYLILANIKNLCDYGDRLARRIGK